MKLRVISDLHFDHYLYHFGAPKIVKIIKDVISDDPEIIIDAGDIGYDEQFLSMFKSALKPTTQHLYVPGNHDRYKAGYKTKLESNFVKEINGVKFVCSTLFGTLDIVLSYIISQNISDFEFATVEEFQKLNDVSRKFLQKNITKDCVVVTHFLPSFKSIADIYKSGKQTLNSFFVSNCEEMILDLEPKLWIHGHTHNPFDYTISKTRVVCNPLGYSHDRSSWNPKLTIEL